MSELIFASNIAPPLMTDENRSRGETRQARYVPLGEPMRPAFKDRLYWGLGLIVLCAILVAQLGMFNKEQLLLHPQIRNSIQKICLSLDCELSPYKDRSKINIIDRGLYKLENETLEFHLAYSNIAQFAQPIPSLKLTLTGFNGEPLAQRLFQAHEYLIEEIGLSTVAPGQPIQARLIFKSPDVKVAGFIFELI